MIAKTFFLKVHTFPLSFYTFFIIAFDYDDKGEIF